MKMFFGHHRQPTAVFILKNCVDFASKNYVWAKLKKSPLKTQRGFAVYLLFRLISVKPK